MSSKYATIIEERIGTTCKITLNRPEKRNAQNGALMDELHDAMNEADRDRSVHVIVLLGAGQSFSAGHDLASSHDTNFFTEYERDQPSEQFRYAKEILFGYWMFIHDLHTPTIAGLHGPVATAGISLAAMCDLIVAADDTTFLDHAVTLFALPGTELSWYPWELGVRKAKEFLWTQQVWDAQKMERLGLVNRVVDRASLEGTVMDMAEQIGRASPTAVSLSKQSLNGTWDAMGKREALKQHFLIQQLGHTTEDSTNRAEGRAGLTTKEWLKAARSEAGVPDPSST